MGTSTSAEKGTAASAPLDPHREISSDGTKAVYVFELPVRLAHWLIVVSVFVLSVTGYCMGAVEMSKTPIGRMDMMRLRAIHLAAGWLFTCCVIVRVFWLFNGNEWSRWHEWIPTHRRRLLEIKEVLRFYFFLRPSYPEPAGGHNVLAGFLYTGLYTFFTFMILSGIALHRPPDNGGWQGVVAAPVTWIGPQTLRLMHDGGMWLIWIFVALHISLTMLIDAETRGNLFNAIFSGWRPRLKGGAEAAKRHLAGED